MILLSKLVQWGVKSVVICDRGEDAVRLVKGDPGPFSLILMDIFLAGQLNGYDAARQIREMTRQPNHQPRIICISMSENDQRRREPSIDDSIPKDEIRQPIDMARSWLPDQLKPFPESAPDPRRTRSIIGVGQKMTQPVGTFSVTRQP